MFEKLTLISQSPVIISALAESKTEGKMFWGTVTSPLYMNSIMALRSTKGISLRITTGYWYGLVNDEKRLVKYGEQALSNSL